MLAGEASNGLRQKGIEARLDCLVHYGLSTVCRHVAFSSRSFEIKDQFRGRAEYFQIFSLTNILLKAASFFLRRFRVGHFSYWFVFFASLWRHALTQ
jgi:hypothetical protein